MRWLWWGLAALWAGLIFWLSASPDARGGVAWLSFPYADKVAHGVAFGVLAVLIYLAWRRPWWVVTLASLYGVSDEVHQFFVPGRSADVTDWLADTLGALVAVLVVKYSLVRYLTRSHRGTA